MCFPGRFLVILSILGPHAPLPQSQISVLLSRDLDIFLRGSISFSIYFSLIFTLLEEPFFA